jgi:hypothetical protein
MGGKFKRKGRKGEDAKGKQRKAVLCARCVISSATLAFKRLPIPDTQFQSAL